MKNASSHGMLRVLWRSLLDMLMTPRNHVDADDEPPFHDFPSIVAVGGEVERSMLVGWSAEVGAAIGY
eukprot:8527-Chlamydomonas_euryale.AAC.1